jgi:hypothetical protein
MENFAGTTLWLTNLAIPYLLFIVGNSFRPWQLTLLRAVVAIGGGWTFMLAYAVATTPSTFLWHAHKATSRPFSMVTGRQALLQPC